MLAFCQARFRTGGRYRRVGHFYVAQGRYSFLRREDSFASGAMRTLLQPCFRTGGRYRFISYFLVAQSRNDFLRYDNCVAPGTMLSCRQPRFCTGGGNRRVDHFIMPQRGNLLRVQCFAAIAANQFLFARFGAGRGLCFFPFTVFVEAKDCYSAIVIRSAAIRSRGRNGGCAGSNRNYDACRINCCHTRIRACPVDIWIGWNCGRH